MSYKIDYLIKGSDSMRTVGFKSRLYDSSQIDKENMLYSAKALVALLIPCLLYTSDAADD